MPTVREYEQTLQQDPAHTDAFLALRKAYREAGKLDRLVTLYECRAQAVGDAAKAAELFYLAAEVRSDHLNDAAGAEADLAHAVAQDPSNVKAAKRLKDMYRQQQRTAEYMTMLEMEAAAVAQSKDPTHLAELGSEMAQFAGQHLVPLERLLATPGRKGEVTTEHLKMVESARKIHRALGDFPSVVRLYELELGAATDAKRRADLMLGLGRVLAEKVEDLEGAAQKIGEVVRLRPRDDKALEALAAVYSHPRWKGGDGPGRAAALYHQVARRRQEAGDTDNAVAALRKALAAAPGHAEASELLERVLYDARRFKDLDRYYRERVAAARSNDERMDFLFKRAQLAEGELGDSVEALRVYEEIVAIEPAGGPASQHLAELYLARQDYGKLAELREKQLEGTSDPGYRVALLQELASLYRDRLGDREQAAVYLHAILQVEPGHPEAMQAYADHFRQRGEWGELADLLEFALEQSAPGRTEDLLPRLEEIAVIAETKLADVERSLAAWQRIETLVPGHERAREAQRRILLRAKRWDGMAELLEREAQGAADPAQKIEILRRLARICVEKLAAADRAAAVYHQILSVDPRDMVALRALVDGYERAEKWPDLAKLLRQQLDLAASKQEKLSLLRRVLVIYDERTGDLAEGIWAATEVLKLAPGDRDALARLESLLERSDDKPRLVQILEVHTRYAATADEKVSLLGRIADLLHHHLGQIDRATGYWEQLARLAPGDGRPLDELAAAYEQLGKSDDLARILEQLIHRSAGDAAQQAQHLRQMAHLTAGALKQPARAQRAWEDLRRLLPADREALEALSEIYRAGGDWRALAETLERRVPLAEDAAVATALALERARVLEEELRRPDDALRALEQIIAEIDPRSVEAHARLRRVAEAKQDWARVVAVVERQIALADDPGEKATRSFELGGLWRDKLRDPRKATSAFERVIEIEPENIEALGALAPLYAAAGDAERLVSTDERLLPHAQDPRERRRLMFEIAETRERGLRQGRQAFEWYRRAYTEAPDDEALGRMEAVAGASGLWEDLIAVYAGDGARSTDPAEQVVVALKVAGLCERRLRSPGRAFEVLREALASEPAGTKLLPELERLAAETREWQALIDVYARVARGRPEVMDRVDLLRRRAQVREERLRDPSGAVDELLRSFALHPDGEDTRREILRLAELTRRWEDALGVEAQLFARAAAVPEKVEIARRAAALVEEKVRDRVRAFRAYLNAFRLAPEDEAIVANLWRLAGLIGHFVAPAKPGEAPGDEKEEEFEDVEQLEEIEEVEEIEAAALPPPRPAPGARPAFETAWEELAQAYELLPAADGAARIRCLKRVADMWERGARDVDRSLAALERVFRLDTTDGEVRESLKRLAASHGRWDDVCAITLRAAEVATREEAVALHHEVAGFREALSQTDLAEREYRAVLLLAADDTAALDRLEALTRTQERWADLADILDKRATDQVRTLAEPAEATLPGEAAEAPRRRGAEARRKSFELADLYEQRLERPYEAIDTLERNLSAVEEDERGFDHPDVAREACLAHESLARLYGRVGLWQKAVGALGRQIELLADARAARPVRWRMFEIYERELGLVDQAALALEAILAADAADEEALASLDKLHQAHGHFEDLQEVLGRRAELAQGAARAELVRRRAQILEEKLGNPDEAAACLRSLGAEALADADTVAALLRNLRRAGLAHEALRVIDQRADLLAKAGADPRALVALRLEQAALKSDQLGDPAGARQAVEAALAAAPDDPEALAALARLHLKLNEFEAYAQARLRQARALGPAPEAGAALIEAGAVYRDQLGNTAEARACFERAVAAFPASEEALRALAALLVAEGQVGEARQLFERQLALVDTPAAKAAVLTDLARTLWEKPGDAPEAIKRLDEALELAPDHVPAVVTMADIYYKEQQWELAERRLNQAVRRTRGQPEQAAKLYQRLAEVYDKLGRLEEGYKQLVEADRLTPGQLLVRIALGENRFRAHKWREAGQHFEGIADHPDAATCPEDVAGALAHGAQAEMKLKRPERSVALYEAALRLCPDHRPSLKALADLALERGEARQAAQYLRRVAESSTDRSERAKLFEELGDLYQKLEDAAAARSAFESAVAAVDQANEAHVPLLEKTLGLERAAGAAREATEIALRMCDLVGDPKERTTRRRELAERLAEQGDHARAAAVLEKALGDSPLDEDVIEKLCAAYDREERAEDIEALLARSLPALPEVADRSAPRRRRADLWQRLGALRGERDAAAAIFALEKAVDAEPERVSARVALRSLYAGRDSFEAAARRNIQLLVQADITRADGLRDLAAGYVADGRIDGARCCHEVLDLLGLAKKADRAFLKGHPAPVLKVEDSYAGTIEEADRARFLAHPEARVLSEVFAAICDGVPGSGKVTLETLGVSAQDRVSPVSELDIGKVFGQTGKALGNKRTNLYVNYDPKFQGVAIVTAPPPAIVIDQRLAAESGVDEMRFRLGRALELTRPEYILAATVPPKEFAQLFTSVLKAFHPRHARWRAGAQGAEQAAQIKKALPYKVAKRLAELFQENDQTPFSSARWRTVVHETASRAGLLMCGDLRAAARLVLREQLGDDAEPSADLLREHAAKPGPLRELLRYAVSEECLALRESLGTAARKAAAA